MKRKLLSILTIFIIAISLTSCSTTYSIVEQGDDLYSIGDMNISLQDSTFRLIDYSENNSNINESFANFMNDSSHFFNVYIVDDEEAESYISEISQPTDNGFVMKNDTMNIDGIVSEYWLVKEIYGYSLTNHFGMVIPYDENVNYIIDYNLSGFAEIGWGNLNERISFK